MDRKRDIDITLYLAHHFWGTVVFVVDIGFYVVTASLAFWGFILFAKVIAFARAFGFISEEHLNAYGSVHFMLNYYLSVLLGLALLYRVAKAFFRPDKRKFREQFTHHFRMFAEFTILLWKRPYQGLGSFRQLPITGVVYKHCTWLQVRHSGGPERI